jgi:hypothetical protein
MNPLDKLKIFKLMNKCKNASLFKDAAVKRTWLDNDGDENAEIVITGNDGKTTQLTVMLKNDVILIALPLSNIGF